MPNLDNEYSQRLKLFDAHLISHFPDKIPDSSLFSLLADNPRGEELMKYCFGLGEMILSVNYSKEKYQEIKLKFAAQSDTVVNTTDSSLILVFSYCDSLEIEGRIFDSHESPESRSLAKHNQSLSQGLPVPHFETEEYGGKTLCGLAPDFNLYLIKTKLGKYLEDKYLQDCGCMPTQWKHGYSKGVALSDMRNVVIYWAIVW